MAEPAGLLSSDSSGDRGLPGSAVFPPNGTRLPAALSTKHSCMQSKKPLSFDEKRKRMTDYFYEKVPARPRIPGARPLTVL